MRELHIGYVLQVHVLAGAFNSPHVTALAWVHLLLLDIVQARWANDSHMHPALDETALLQACKVLTCKPLSPDART